MQYKGSRAMPVCRMRRCEFSTLCRRWRLWQTRCPSSRASCRRARTCALSGMRYFCQEKFTSLPSQISVEKEKSVRNRVQFMKDMLFENCRKNSKEEKIPETLLHVGNKRKCTKVKYCSAVFLHHNSIMFLQGSDMFVDCQMLNKT